MKRSLIIAALLLIVSTSFAQSFEEWKNPTVNQVNRLPMHASFTDSKAQTLSLHGDWKFHWSQTPDERPDSFFKVKYDDGKWDRMPVPGMWALNGFGDPLYVNAGYAWGNWHESQPPLVPEKRNQVGSYRRFFVIPSDWNGKEVIAHFGSVTSNIYLWVNGKVVGYSEDSKLECEFDITKFVKPGSSNLIAFQVFRWCDGTYLEDQDFFRYAGVARESYLYTRPANHIEDINVTSGLQNNYSDGTLAVKVDLNHEGNVQAVLRDAAGGVVDTKSGKGKLVQFDFNVAKVNLF